MIRVLPRENLYQEASLATFFTFSGGEPHTDFNPQGYKDFVIDARVGSADDFMRVLMVTDAIRRAVRNPRIALFIPYFPGARQDRVEPLSGYSLTVKVYADIINHQLYDQVIIADPHSEVTPALLDRCTIIPSSAPLVQGVVAAGTSRDYAGIIAPDAGATKRALAAASVLRLPVVTATKKRNPQTGRVTDFVLGRLPETGNYLVVDDLCDGGATFVGLAREFRKQAPLASLDLWVTHGIFSQGLEKLFTDYRNIMTTDSFPGAEPQRITDVAAQRFIKVQLIALLDGYLEE